MTGNRQRVLNNRQPLSWRAAGIAIALFTLLSVLDPAAAQVSLGSVGKDSGGTTLVEEQRVIDNVHAAFGTTLEHRLESARPDLTDSDYARARRLAAELREEFDTRFGELITDLKGDGVLEADEISSEAGDLRDSYLGEFDRALTALKGGHPPPPLRDEFDSRWQYAAAVAHYTFVTRNDALDWLWLALALGGGLLSAWLVSRGLRAFAKRWRRADREWIAELGESLVGPLYLTSIMGALYAGLSWLWIPGIAGNGVNRIVTGGFAAAGFWFLWNACKALALAVAWIIEKTYQREIDKHLIVVISRILRIVVLIAAVLVLVNVVLDSNLTGIVAGLGVIGVALSFILRGTIENVAASFTIFGDKPFRVGDLIVYGDELGTVEDVGFRSTRFRTLDGHLITIPNSKLVDDAIHNVGARPSIRRRFRIGLTYDTPPEKVREAIGIVKELLEDHEGQPADAPPRVVFETFGDYDLRLLVQYYYTPADYWKALEFDTQINLAIMERFAEAGIEFAYPTQTMYLASRDEAFPVSADVDARGVAPADERERDETSAPVVRASTG